MSGYFLKLASSDQSVEEKTRVFFVDAPSKNLICPLCQNVFDDPVISECGHTFCRKCISEHKLSHCPVHQDRKLSVVVDNLAVWEQVCDLNVRCQFGVKWVSHDSSDTDSGSTGSSSVTSAVSASSCGTVGPSPPVGIIVEDGCPIIIKYGEKRAHEQTCEYRQVPCTNSAECSPIRKKDLQSHLARCRRARCRFQTYGCTFCGNESELAIHETSECRFEPVKEYFRQVDEKLQEQNEQLKEKDQEIVLLRSVVTKLSERVDELELKVESLQETSARTELDVVDMRRDMDTLSEKGGRRGSLVVGEIPCGNGSGDLRCIGTFVGHEGPVWCLTEAAGCLFSGSSDTTIKVWDILETYQCMKTLSGHKDIVLSLHTVNGKLFSGSSDLCFNVWSTDTFSLIRRVKAHDNAVCAITSTDDRLFTGSLGKIKVWDMSSFALVKEIDGTNWFRALTVNEGILISGSKEAVLLWDLKTYECVRTLEFTGGSIYSLGLFGKRFLFGGTQENNIQVWDLTTYERLSEMRGHTGAVYALNVVNCTTTSTDEEDHSKAVLVSGAYDRALRVWALDEHDQFMCTQTMSRHSGSVSCLLSCGGRIYSGAIDSTIKVWCL